MHIIFTKQHNYNDCGIACLKMLADSFGIDFNYDKTRLKYENRIGITINDLAHEAQMIGLKSIPLKVNFKTLIELPRPSIILWDKDHYISKMIVTIADPLIGIISYDRDYFRNRWYYEGKNGIVLIIEEI